MMKRLAVVVGINDYPGSSNDLHGCVNDALDWHATLLSHGYDVTELLLDGDATRDNVTDALTSAVSRLRFGDRLVWTYSGHGSTIPDTSGDEPDKTDECIVLHDWQQSGFLVDDEIGAMLDQRRAGSSVITISDSCFSGTVARFVDTTAQPRYFPAEYLTPREVVAAPRRLQPTILLSGCDEHEVSYDATIDGRPRGAFSWAALSTIRPNQTISAWHDATRELLPSQQYPQTPQLQATRWQKRMRL